MKMIQSRRTYRFLRYWKCDVPSLKLCSRYKILLFFFKSCIYWYIFLYMDVYDISLIWKHRGQMLFFQKQPWGVSFKMVDSLVLLPESLMKWKHQKIKQKNSVRLKRICWKRTLNGQEISTNFWETKQEMEMRCQKKQWGTAATQGHQGDGLFQRTPGRPQAASAGITEQGGGQWVANRDRGVSASSPPRQPPRQQSLQAAPPSVRTDKHLGVRF